MVLGEHHLGLIAVAQQRLVQVVRPDLGIAHLCATQGQYVVLHMGGVFGHAQGFERREPQVHLGGCFSAGRELELDIDAVDTQGFERFFDQPSRGDKADCGIGRHTLAQPRVNLAAWPAWQRRTIHVLRPALHRRPGQYVLADGMFEETLRGNDLDLAGLYVGLVDHPAHAAEMIDVWVGVDHRHHRALRAMPEVHGQPGPGGLDRQQRVHHDQPVLAFDQGHVGQVQAAYLVDAVGDLEQPGDGIELGDAPQAGVDRCRCLALEEGVALQVPDRFAIGIEHRLVDAFQQAAAGVVEVSPVVEGQALQPLLVALARQVGGIVGRRLGKHRGGQGEGQQGGQVA